MGERPRAWHLQRVGMDRPAASLNPVWLLWADVGDASVDRLSWLARVEARSLSAIMPTVGWSLPAQAPYCYVCLVHNTALTSPRLAGSLRGSLPMSHPAKNMTPG